MNQPKVYNNAAMLAHIKEKVGDSASSYGGLGPNEARVLLAEVEKLSADKSELMEALEGAAMIFRMWDHLPEQAQGPAMRKALMYAEKAMLKAKGEATNG